MKNTRKQVGDLGEDIVCRYLENIGHCILERNWRTGHLEIDIISLSKDGIHFIEVKSRVAPIYVEPQYNVGITKQKRIAKAASRYVSRQELSKFEDIDLHLDVATVVFDEGKEIINYIRDAYIPIIT